MNTLARLLSLIFVAAGLCCATAQEPAPSGEFDQTHALWTQVLGRGVKGDRFDYKKLGENRDELDRYLMTLVHVTPEEFKGWTREQQYAFWINAYNAFTVQIVLQNYPLKSIKDIGGEGSGKVWDDRFIRLGALFPDAGGEKISLNDIEHKLLRPKFKDARVHAAINCASIGCPPLRAEAFTADGLDDQLDAQVRTWLADSRRTHYDAKTRTVEASELFNWFGEDFVRDAGSVEAWIARYAPSSEAAWMKQSGKIERQAIPYDWTLNDVPRK